MSLMRTLPPLKRALVSCRCLVAVGLLVSMLGCRMGDARLWGVAAPAPVLGDGSIHRVACLYDQDPWLSLDLEGDRDPEGIKYRIFLDPGTGRGVLREGMFHIEMYQLGRDSRGKRTRELVSDWHYPTSRIPTIACPGAMGEGYFVHLRWAKKDTAGHDIEIVTTFEHVDGRTIRSATKHFRVPKYSS